MTEITPQVAAPDAPHVGRRDVPDVGRDGRREACPPDRRLWMVGAS